MICTCRPVATASTLSQSQVCLSEITPTFTSSAIKTACLETKWMYQHCYCLKGKMKRLKTQSYYNHTPILTRRRRTRPVWHRGTSPQAWWASAPPWELDRATPDNTWQTAKKQKYNFGILLDLLFTEIIDFKFSINWDNLKKKPQQTSFHFFWRILA